LELTHRKAVYKEGFAQFIAKLKGRQVAWKRDWQMQLRSWKLSKKAKRPKVEKALTGYVADCPPGDREGNTFRRVFERVRCEFAEKNQRICLSRLPSKDPDIWKTAPIFFMESRISRANVNYVLFRGSSVAERLRLRPCLPPKKVFERNFGN
jgi:hypothetical protein